MQLRNQSGESLRSYVERNICLGQESHSSEWDASLRPECIGEPIRAMA